MDGGSSETLRGYAAYGANRRVALQPLVDQFTIPLFEDGERIRAPLGTVREPGPDELGCDPDTEEHPGIEQTQVPPRTLPRSLALTYYDPARDYQTGQMRATAATTFGVDEVVELAAVMAADKAKALAEGHIARRWAERDRLVLRLPPDYLSIEPGALIAMADGTLWRVQEAAIERMAIRLELSRIAEGPANLAADPGSHLPASDLVAVPTVLAVLDLPDLGIGRHDVPVLQVAACQPVAGWRQVPLEVTVAGELLTLSSARSEAVIGTAINVLPDGPSVGFDDINFVEVELADGEHWLESSDDNALANGANLAAIGSELIQFGRAVPTGQRRFRLEHLLRGRRGTEWATGSHAPNERLVLIAPGSLQEIALPPSAIGASVSIKPRGLADDSAVPIEQVATGEAMRPPSPVDLLAESQTDGGLALSWTRRSRLGWNRPAGVEVPLGESSERYRVTLEGSTGTLTFQPSEPQLLVPASALTGMAGVVVIRVIQIGDFAESRPATTSVVI